MADETILIKVEVEGASQTAQEMTQVTTAVEKQEQSIAKLREENKKLTKERNEVNLNSEKGRERLKELNEQLDANNKKIKENVDQYTKQKIGVGDYKGALDKLIPGLGATADGFTAMKDTAMKFIATPIGAVIGAVGLALGALIAYFKNTGEGQDKLTGLVNIGKVAFEGLMRVVESLGKVLFTTLEWLGGVAEKVIGFISPATAQAIQAVKDAADEISKLDDAIDAFESDMVVKRAATANQVARLRAEAIQQEGAVKRASIQEAISLEEELAAKEVELAQMKLDLFLKEHQTKTDLTDEEVRQKAELEAAKIAAETASFENTLRLRKELEALDEQARAQQNLIDEEQALIKQRAREADTTHEVQQNEIKLLSIKKLTDAQIAAGLKLGANQVAARIKDVQETQKSEATKSRITELENKNRLLMVSTSLGLAAGLLEKDTIAYKFLTAARASIDTFAAATEALPNYFLAALVTATGLANVSKILGVGFAEGGYTGEGRTNEVAGVVHRKEYVVPAHIVQNPIYSGHLNALEKARTGYQDGGLVVNTAAQQIESQAMLANAMKNINFFVSWREGYEMGEMMRFKERITSI